MADEATMKAFRQLEAELDAHHQTLPFFNAAPETGCYALLAAFDGLYIVEPYITPQTHFDVCIMQDRRSYEEGLSQALRWLLGENATIDPVPVQDDEAIERGFRMIKYAGDYYQIETFHVMLGKGWVDVTVDLEQKRVRFEVSADRNVRKTMAGYEEGFGKPQIPHHGAIRDEFSAAFRSAKPHIDALKHELRDGRIVLLDLAQLNHPTIVAQQTFFQIEFEDIPSDADLAGFTVEEFQGYWRALNRWSRCVVHLYLNKTFGGVNQRECMPTQCVPKDEFLSGISLLSGLKVGKTQIITDRLSWGGSLRRPDILLQPLIVGPRTVSWSPRVIDASRYPRNMLRLMAKMGGPTKKIADNLIGQREVPAASRLGAFMAAKKRRRWQYKAGKTIKGGGKEGQIDLLAWTPERPEELLLIEYKATLEVAEVHEIGDATILMQEGQEQLRRCIEILGLLTPEEKKVVFPFVPWDRIKAMYGVVVSSGGNPSEKYDHSRFPAVTRDAFLTKLRSNDFLRPSRLWSACRERNWLEHFDDCEFGEIEIRIGDLTYFVPGVKFSDDPRNDVEKDAS